PEHALEREGVNVFSKSKPELSVNVVECPDHGSSELFLEQALRPSDRHDVNVWAGSTAPHHHCVAADIMRLPLGPAVTHWIRTGRIRRTPTERASRRRAHVELR